MFLRFKKTWSVIFALIVLMLLLIVAQFYQEQQPSNLEDKKIYCTAESRDAEACIQIYEPVCGFSVNDEQIKAFGNSCFACMNQSVEYFIIGECLAQKQK